MPARRRFEFHSEKSGTALTVRVIPGAEKSKISKIRPDGCVVVNLDCETSDERCHPALLKFLGGVLSVVPAQLEIVAGVSGDYKIISILGMSSSRADELIRAGLRKE